MKFRLSTVVAVFFVPLVAPLALHAQLSREDHEAAKQMLSGTFYLRSQAPQKYGMGHWGPYSLSILEASPAGLSTERKLAEPLKSIPGNAYHLKQEEIYWGYLANTPVDHCKLQWEKDTNVVWCERVDPNTELSVDFINVKTLADFTKAFNLTFSKVPLQNEHSEWPSDIKESIAAGKLAVGMTTEQAKIVVGSPLSTSTGEDNGAKTETWTLRQDPGQVLGWNKKRGAWKKVGTQTGFPASVTFKDGKLQSIQQTPAGPSPAGK